MPRTRSEGQTTRSNLELSLLAPQSFVDWLLLCQLWRLLEWPHLEPQERCLVRGFQLLSGPKPTTMHPRAQWPVSTLPSLAKHVLFPFPFVFLQHHPHNPSSLICIIALTTQRCSEISPV